MTTPAPSPPQAAEPVSPVDRRGQRVYIWWAIALALLLALSIFSWLVVVPVWRVHSAIEAHFVTGWVINEDSTDPPFEMLVVDSDAAIADLGGPEEALLKLRIYAAMPDFIAGHEQHAKQLQQAAAEALGRIKAARGPSATAPSPPDRKERADEVVIELGMTFAEAAKRLQRAGGSEIRVGISSIRIAPSATYKSALYQLPDGMRVRIGGDVAASAEDLLGPEVRLQSLDVCSSAHRVSSKGETWRSVPRVRIGVDKGDPRTRRGTTEKIKAAQEEK